MNGDPAEGVHVVARVWSAADKPPTLAVQNPNDLVRVVEKDKWMRTLLQGTGKWHLEGDTATLKTAHVNLGDDAPTEQLVLGTTYRQAENTMNQQVIAALATLTGLIATAGASLTTAGPLTLLPPAGIAIAAAGAALTSATALITQIHTAITTFDTSPTSYLSNVSKTK
jgi:hypothetical protein